MNSWMLLATVTIGGAAAALSLVLLRRRLGRLRYDRGLAALQLALRGGARYARSAPRLFAAAGEQRQLLRGDLALRTAEDVASTLGAMKGVLMKVGQMASYVDDGLSPAVRRTLARLQDSVAPMSPELAAAVVEEELGAPPERAFARWDPQPIAAASIGQVHRAITLDGRAVAVKVQYPGIAETIAADLRNVALLRRMLRIAAPAQDVDALLAELRERVAEELDYRREAANQRRFAADHDEGRRGRGDRPAGQQRPAGQRGIGSLPAEAAEGEGPPARPATGDDHRLESTHRAGPVSPVTWTPTVPAIVFVSEASTGWITISPPTSPPPPPATPAPRGCPLPVAGHPGPLTCRNNPAPEQAAHR